MSFDVYYYDKITKKIAHIETNYETESEAKSDAATYEYGYIAVIEPSKNIIYLESNYCKNNCIHNFMDEFCEFACGCKNINKNSIK